MRTLYGRISSINVQKAAWALAELGLEFDWIDKDGTVGSIDSSKYREINPAAQIPTVYDDGIILRQSNAIVRYLAHTYSEGDLCPLDPQAYAEAERWMEWQATDLWNFFRPVFWGLVRLKPEDRDMAEIGKNINVCHQEMTLLNDFLKDRTYIAGEAFSMGDIPAGCAAYRYYALPSEQMKRPHLPHVEAWYDRLCERHAFQEYIMLPLE
jgi:glutathione S-transferase